MGIAPTDKSVKANNIDVLNTKDGKLHENWVQMDFAGLMQQLNSSY